MRPIVTKITIDIRNKINPPLRQEIILTASGSNLPLLIKDLTPATLITTRLTVPDDTTPGLPTRWWH